MSTTIRAGAHLHQSRLGAITTERPLVGDELDRIVDALEHAGLEPRAVRSVTLNDNGTAWIEPGPPRLS